MRTVRSLSALTVGLVLVLVAACTPSAPDSGSESTGAGGGEVLHIGTTADVVNYNPLVGNSRTDSWVTNLMYPKLMTMQQDASLQPYLATEWGYSDDGKTARVTIRDDMQWSDGEPITADDVVFTIEAIAKEQIGVVAGLIGSSYESAKAVSDTEIEFQLSRPDGTFLTNIGFWMPIVPEHVFSKGKTVQGFANDSNWVSAGPYRLTEVDRGQRYVMERVTPYPLAPDDTPTLKQVVFRVYPDVNTEILALRNGDLDMIANPIPPAQVQTLEAGGDVELTQVPSLGWAHMQFNTEREPLDDAAVRNALAHAIDYDAIREVVLQGQAQSADGSVLTPALPFWDDPSIQEWKYDPQLARKKLQQAGFRDADGDGMFDDLSLDMVYDQADPNIAGWAQIVRDTFAKAGVQLKLAGLERNTYLARASERNFDIYAGSWAIMENPPAYLDLAFSSGGFINYGNVSDPKLDRLITKARTALSREQAKPFVQQAAQRIHDQVYDVVLYVETFNIAHSGAWEGFEKKPSELLSIVNPQSLDSVTPAD